MESENAKQNQNLAIPGAIIVAGLIIAGAIFYSNGGGGNAAFTRTADDGRTGQTAGIENFRLVESDDHIRGNPDAAITLVEFSDLECPFCKSFHPTMKRIVEEFDDVRWVYRHFPLTSIHSEAQDAAVASECVAKIGGNDAFWQFTDAVFENQDRLSAALYKEIAEELGLDTEAFSSCFANKETLDDVNADLKEAIASGGGGTPFSVIILPDGQLTSFSGALSYENVTVLLDQIRGN